MHYSGWDQFDEITIFYCAYRYVKYYVLHSAGWRSLQNSEAQQTDVMIFEIFSPKKWQKLGVFYSKHKIG
jgi:hypothetical protein